MFQNKLTKLRIVGMVFCTVSQFLKINENVYTNNTLPGTCNMNVTKTKNKDADIFNDLILMAAMHMNRTISGKINIRRSPIR